jgi:hypothetical protein
VEQIAEHPVPKGPLAVRWLALDQPRVEAGALTRVRVELENAGSAAWPASRSVEGIKLSYHWLDARGNPIVWDGLRRAFEQSVEPGERRTIDLELRGPIPPGAYRLALDLVEEGRFWFAQVGGTALVTEVHVAPRDASSARAWLPEDGEPAPDREERIRTAHEEGYAAVGGSIEAIVGRLGRVPREFAAWAPGGGRNPAFGQPLLCPSLLPPLEPNEELFGLPAWRPEGGEPWLYDGRIRLRARLPVDRPRG